MYVIQTLLARTQCKHFLLKLKGNKQKILTKVAMRKDEFISYCRKSFST